MTYSEEEWAPPLCEFDWVRHRKLVERKRIVRASETDLRHLTSKTFSQCDLAFPLNGGTFTDCVFEGCRFAGCTWDRVKFSGCAFRFCHFSHVTFRRCDFLSTCKFEANSASAEHLSLEDTAISATAFLSAVTGNLSYLRVGVTKDYQRSRLIETKEKLAQAIYTSTKDRPEVAFYYEAHKELQFAVIDQSINKWRYNGKVQRSLFQFYCLTFLHRIEWGLIRLSGAITSWGRGTSRILGAFFAMIIVFAIAYYFLNSMTCLSALRRSIDISVVAGYTAHCGEKDTEWFGVRFLNMLLGVYWYSLMIPVLIKRALR